MIIRDLPTLDKTLLNSEFETAKAIYDQAITQGYSPVKAAALVYRNGVLDGKEREKGRTNEVYKRFHEFVERTKANGGSLPEAIKEGSENNE